MTNPTRATEIEIDEAARGFLVYHPRGTASIT
jgi:hypothetical protein